ncbi:hypothetical protein R4J09_00610 [Brachyspira intermedia]|uniref:hypothetical protein n=1 Tax=Brachyspira intermedia TaxID=84377 RepID=UPI0030045BC5
MENEELNLEEQIKEIEKQLLELPQKKEWFHFIFNSNLENQKLELENRLKELQEKKNIEDERIAKEKLEREIEEQAKQNAIDYLKNLKAIEADITLNKEYCLFKYDNIMWAEPRKIRGVDTFTIIDTGTLYITNEKIILKTDSETKNFKISSVIDIDFLKNGVEVSRIKGKNIRLGGDINRTQVYIIYFLIDTIRKNELIITEKKQ